MRRRSSRRRTGWPMRVLVAGPDIMRLTFDGRANSAFRHDDDGMGAVFGTGMDVGVETVRAHLYVVERGGAKVPRQSFLSLRETEHRISRTGDGDTHACRRRCNENADDGKARRGVWKFGVPRAFRNWKVHRGDDFTRLKRGFKQSGE